MLAEPSVPAGKYEFTLSLSYTTDEGSIDESYSFRVQIIDQRFVVYRNPEDLELEDVQPPSFYIREISSIGQVHISFS